MSGRAGLPSLVRDLYSAATDERQWPAVLERLADEYGGGLSGFNYRDAKDGRVRSARLVRIDPALVQAAIALGAQNPWTRLSQPLFRAHGPGFVYASQSVLSPSALRRTEYYDCVLRPAKALYGFGACVAQRGNEFLSFTVVRSQARGPFEAADLDRVRPILPHIARVLQVNERLSQIDRTRAVLADALEALQHGVAVVDRRGHVVFANRALRDIAAEHDGLAIARDGLVASARNDRLRLRMLLEDAVRTAEGDGTGSGGTMTISRPSAKRPYLAVVAPLPIAFDSARPVGLATVFISDPEARPEAPEEFLRRTHGFTPREGQVASTFAATGSIDGVAEQLSIGRETVRWHLRQIYAKTGTRRQSELLKRLIDGPAQLRLDALLSTPTDFNR